MITSGKIYFDEQEIEIETIAPELKERIRVECPSMYEDVWGVPAQDEEPEADE